MKEILIVVISIVTLKETIIDIKGYTNNIQSTILLWEINKDHNLISKVNKINLSKEDKPICQCLEKIRTQTWTSAEPTILLLEMLILNNKLKEFNKTILLEERIYNKAFVI